MYAHDELTAIQACFLLKQCGFQNHKVIYGGYSFLLNPKKIPQKKEMIQDDYPVFITLLNP